MIRGWSIGALMLVVLGLACGSDGNYSLQVNFPSSELLQDTARLLVWVVEADSCEQVPWGDLDSENEEVISSQVIESPGSLVAGTGGGLDRVPNGVFVFAAEGRTATGARILRGCTQVEVKAGASVVVTVDLVCVCEPVPGICAPVEENAGNGLDDDCDGETDECMSEHDCNDENVCTQDICVMGQCQYPSWPDGLDCSEGNACITGGKCLGGACVGDEKNCSELDAICARGVCNPETGACEAVEAEDMTPCGEGLFCTENDVCMVGVCVAGGDRDCDDVEPCTRDECNEAWRACMSIWEPKIGAEGPAGDANCSDGEDNDCDHLVDLDDPDCNPCVMDEDCDDGNFCTSNTCVDSACLAEATNEAGGCEDGLYCTEGDVCVGGVCRGEARDCVAGDSCHVGFCLEDENRCDERQKDDGESCDDDFYCTVQDRCLAGTCEGQERECNDNNTCTLDDCDEQLSKCTHDFLEVPGAEGPVGDATCGNGVDDDCDGWTDGDDLDCGFVYQVLKALVPPAIDGNCEEYAGAPILTMLSNDNEQIVYRMMWDESAIYICSEVTDSSLDAGFTDPVAERDGYLWRDDSLEILFDVEHDGGTSVHEGDYKFLLNVANVQCDANPMDKVWSIDFDSHVVADGTINDDVDVDTGYVAEFSLSWSAWGIAAPGAGDVWGFDLKVNDKDSVEQTEEISVIWANTDGGSVNSANGFGDAVFMESQ